MTATRARRPSPIARYLWSIIVLLGHADPPAGAAGRAHASSCPIRLHVVLSRPLQIVAIPAALAADTTNRLLTTARTAACRAIRHLTRGPLTGRAAAIPGTFMTRPMPPSAADAPGHRTPNLAQRTKSGSTTSTNTRPEQEPTKTKIKKAGEREDQLHRTPQHAISYFFRSK